MSGGSVKTSARNQFAGTVGAVRPGAVNDEIELRIASGQTLVAVVTAGSTAALGLAPGSAATALVKASSVLLAVGLDGWRLSARNRLQGTVGTMAPGAVNAEVRVDIDGGGAVTAIVTRASADELGLAPGVAVTAFFKASSVILAVPA